MRFSLHSNGEGLYTGQLTIFVRFFGCNLSCGYFGQPPGIDIEKPDTWLRPYYKIPLHDIKNIKELPVFSVGCDSSYSWSVRYKHLARNMTALEIKDEIFRIAAENYNINLLKEWNNPNRSCSSQIQLCFTGGEPMLHQEAITNICREIIYDDYNYSGVIPRVTIETNATIKKNDLHIRGKVAETHFSISPKLYYVSGEKNKVDLNVIEDYLNYADSSAIKFVLNNDDNAWHELDFYLSKIRNIISNDFNCGIYCMPCGSDLESQNSEYLSQIVKKAFKRQMNISLRNHIFAFGNSIRNIIYE